MKNLQNIINTFELSKKAFLPGVLILLYLALCSCGQPDTDKQNEESFLTKYQPSFTILNEYKEGDVFYEDCNSFPIMNCTFEMNEETNESTYLLQSLEKIDGRESRFFYSIKLNSNDEITYYKKQLNQRFLTISK